MPWNESTKMDEKLKFVSRYLDGEKIAEPNGINKSSTIFPTSVTTSKL
jgi:hypothetical protein